MKSKADAAWTTKKLAKRASHGDLPRSILGKANYNIDQFGPNIQRAGYADRPIANPHQLPIEFSEDAGDGLKEREAAAPARGR